MNCMRCGADVSSCYKTPGDGPICCDLEECELRQILAYAKRLQRRWPWPEGFVAPGMGDFYSKLRGPQTDLRRLFGNQELSEIARQAERYDELWRQLLYLGMAACQHRFLRDPSGEDVLVLEVDEEDEALDQFLLPIFRKFPKAGVLGGLTDVMMYDVIAQVRQINAEGFAAWATRHGAPAVQMVEV